MQAKPHSSEMVNLAPRPQHTHRDGQTQREKTEKEFGPFLLFQRSICLITDIKKKKKQKKGAVGFFSCTNTWQINLLVSSIKLLSGFGSVSLKPGWGKKRVLMY